jgi:hypothetical protein
MEERMLPSVTVTVNGSDATFSSLLVTDNVYLQTNGSQVQWSPDGNTWSNVGVTVAPAGGENTFTFKLSGDVYLEDFTGAGGNLTFGGTGDTNVGFTGPRDLHIQSNLLTQGGNLTINDVQGVDIGSSEVVSTRNISLTDLANGNYSGTSVGNSGTINVTVGKCNHLGVIRFTPR